MFRTLSLHVGTNASFVLEPFFNKDWTSVRDVVIKRVCGVRWTQNQLSQL